MLHFAYAGIDVGTSSALLTVVRPTDSGFHKLDERCVVTRLGEGLGEDGALSEEAMARTLMVLEDFGAAIVALGAKGSAATTSATRRAKNGDEFLTRAQEALGIPVRVLSGDEEARLSYLGALDGLDLPEHEPLLVDPGGGSTEVHWQGEGSISLEVGALRLTERFVSTDPPRPEEMERLRRYVRKHIQDAGLTDASSQAVVAVGGTATTLAAVALELPAYDADAVHGTVLSVGKIKMLTKRLASLRLVEREKIPCVQRERAKVIVGGALLIEELLDHLGATSVTVSDRGLRYGLIREMLSRES